MAEVIKKATRDGYGNALVELAEKYDNLIVMDADRKSTRLNSSHAR